MERSAAGLALEAERVRRLLAAKYGFADRWIGVLVDTSRSVAIRLEPLGDADVDELIPERIVGELRDKIARASGGNPLFIEEMLAVARETDGQVTVPPTLQALLARFGFPPDASSKVSAAPH